MTGTLDKPSTGSPAESIDYLMLDLRDTARPHIVFAVADDPVLRDEARAALADRLAGAYELHSYGFQQGIAGSLPAYARSLSRRKPTCVFATGLPEVKAGNEGE